MTGFASKLINTLFKKRASARPAAVRRRAALGVEPLETRAVLSTVVPTTVADDVVVDGPIITGQDFDSPRSGGGAAGGGAGAGKVSMNDFQFVMRNNAASRHAGGVNASFGDGSVRFISDSIDLPATRAGAGKVSMNDFHFVMRNNAASRHAGGANVLLGDGSVRYIKDSITTGSELAGTGAHGSGGGTGKVSMRDFDGVGASGDDDRLDIIVVAGGAPGGHVKAFDGTRGPELQSFFAFPGFNGGVSVASALPSGGFSGGIFVAAGDVDGADFDVTHLEDGGRGTHVAGTIGALPPAVGGAGTPNGHVRVFDGLTSADGSAKAAAAGIESGVGYCHPDLYLNVWINQALQSAIDDIAADVARVG